ncbi:MAG TPA: phage integrase N-terminal SAM-like domain-containing protein, partial [Gemmatimonadales bacterium]|nr:phage integrase N-terminal SAM-like domain-containing protein [Gemmatimonadales bacterium]
MSETSPVKAAGPRTLLGRLRAAVRARHYSARTEESYVGWAKRFVVFHGRRHPEALGEAEVRAFLDHLAEHERVSASTQNQAVAALLFLYEAVLGRRLTLSPQGIVHAKELQRLPVVLSREEVRAVLAQLPGVPRLVALLLYGSGLRLLECLSLRVKDVDFQRGEIRVRGGKGGVDRVVPLPLRVQGPLTEHLARWRSRHAREVERRGVRVALPGALERKSPGAVAE